MSNKRIWQDILESSPGIAEKMALVAFDVDSFKDPEDALSQRAAAAKTRRQRKMYADLLEDWEGRNFESLVQELAKNTGADPAQIRNKNTRTPEQQQALMELSAKRQFDRLDAYHNSAYRQALRLLDGEKSRIKQPPAEDEYSTRETAVIYFFATHPETQPSSLVSLTEQQQAELREIFKKYETFLSSYQAGSKTPAQYIEALKAFITQDNPTEAERIIENLSSVIPEMHVIPNNKLTNVLTRIPGSAIASGRKVDIEVSAKGAKKSVKSNVMLQYEGSNVELVGRRPITEFDRSVYNAVTSLYVYGDQGHVYTPAQIFRAMVNADETENPSPQQIAAVEDSVDKMRFTRAYIDCTEELKARRATYNSKQINKGQVDTYLLTAYKVSVQAGGHTVTAYEIVRPPILYEYSSAVRQVLTLPASMLEIKLLGEGGGTTSRSLPMTEQRIIIRDYLLRRIEGMKGENSLTNTSISLYSYEKNGEKHPGLYARIGKENGAKIELMRIRADVKKMLDYWKSVDFIADYRIEQEKNGKITGYKIILPAAEDE